MSIEATKAALTTRLCRENGPSVGRESQRGRRWALISATALSTLTAIR